MADNSINYLDLFSGCGGFRYGLAQNEVKIGYEAHSDVDRHANETYKRHFPESEALGDIKSIRPVRGRLNGHKINLITFGFPCQDLSVAGKGQGFEGDRSALFYEAMRIVKGLKPEVFIFENVKGIFSNKDGRTFTTVLREIADIGLYECEWQLLNTRWFLPQNRERVYFIGHLRGKSRPKVFPIGEEIAGSNERTKQTAVNCLTAGGNSGGLHSSMTLLAVATPQRQVKTQNGSRFNNKHMFTLTSQDQHGVLRCAKTIRCGGRGSHNSPKHNWDTYMVDGSLRRLTPTECCRLHGYPDNWVEHLSDTQAYKQMGNTVSPVVTAEIFKRLYR